MPTEKRRLQILEGKGEVFGEIARPTEDTRTRSMSNSLEAHKKAAGPYKGRYTVSSRGLDPRHRSSLFL